MYLLIIQLLCLLPGVLFVLWMIFSIASIAKGAPFIRTRNDTIETMVRLGAVKQGDLSVDIGSGSGRIVFAFARAGAKAYGYEINYFLVLWSRVMSVVLGLRGKVFFQWGNLWQTDFSQFEIVTVYGIPFIMKDLEKKLLRELKPGSRIISNTFQFPTIQPCVTEGSVFLYVVPELEK